MLAPIVSVPKSDIAANDTDLGLNRYKEIIQDEIERVPPKQLLEELSELERETSTRAGRFGGNVEMSRHAALGEVAEFINGVAFKPEDWGDEGRRIIRIQNLTDSGKPFNRTLREVDSKYHVLPNDLLVSWSASLGVFEWSGPDTGLLNQHIFRVIHDPSVIDRRYIRHALDLALSDMRRHLHGATMQHVNRGEFLATKILLPPIGEQRRIAAILDKTDDLRINRRNALTKLDSLGQSIFFDMFGDPVRNEKKWRRVALGGLLEAIESGWSPVCLDRPATETEWGVLKLGAVTWCKYDDTEQKALPVGIEPRPELEVKPGDLLFTRKNTYELVAATVYVRETRPNLMLSDLIFRLRLSRDAPVAPDFLHQLLVSPSKRRQIQKLASGSAGSMPNISKERLSAATIELPPIELQRNFARRLSAIERLQSTSEQSLGMLTLCSIR